MRAIDDLLGGGIPPGIVMDVFGSNGTGKTQLLHQAAARFALGGRRVLYVDTTGTFRPERVLQMAGSARRGVLDMIHVARIWSVASQIDVTGSLPSGRFGLVAIDSLTDLFSYEYSRYGDLRERNRLFFGYVRGLARLAVRGRVAVLTSNMVRSSGSDGKEVENMAAEIDLFAHVRIHLVKKEENGRSHGAASGTGGRLRGYVSCAIRQAGGGGLGRGVHPGGTAATAAAADGTEGEEEEEHDATFSYEILASGIRTCDNGGIDLPPPQPTS